MKKAIEAINELKKRELIRDYAIAGAIAVLKWTEPFFTRDLDIIITLPKETGERKLIVLTPIYEYLKQAGSQWNRQWIIVEGVPVDFIVADKLEKEAIENAIETEYEGLKTKILTPEYLIALFIRAGRNKDERKIEMLLEQTEIDMEKLRKILVENGLMEKFSNFKERYYGK